MGPILRLPKDGEPDVDLRQLFEEKGVVLKTKPDGTIEANFVRPIREVHESGSGGYYSASPSSTTESSKSLGGHTKNYTPYKDQREEFMSTSKINGRVFNYNTGQYVTGQENKVYVNGYTTKNGTVVNPVTRSYPTSSGSNPGSNSGNSGGQGIPGSPNPNP